jgi:hypothetical protein
MMRRALAAGCHLVFALGTVALLGGAAPLDPWIAAAVAGIGLVASIALEASGRSAARPAAASRHPAWGRLAGLPAATIPPLALLSAFVLVAPDVSTMFVPDRLRPVVLGGTATAAVVLVAQAMALRATDAAARRRARLALGSGLACFCPLGLWLLAVSYWASQLPADLAGAIAVHGMALYTPNHSRRVALALVSLAVLIVLGEIAVERRRLLAADPEAGPAPTVPYAAATDVVLVALPASVVAHRLLLGPGTAPGGLVEIAVCIAVAVAALLYHRRRSVLAFLWGAEAVSLPLLVVELAPGRMPGWVLPATALLPCGLAVLDYLQRERSARERSARERSERSSMAVANAGPTAGPGSPGLTAEGAPSARSASPGPGSLPALVLGAAITAWVLFDLGDRLLYLHHDLDRPSRAAAAGYPVPLERGVVTLLAAYPREPRALAHLAWARCMHGENSEALTLARSAVRAARAGRAATGCHGLDASGLLVLISEHAGQEAAARSAFRRAQPARPDAGEEPAVALQQATALIDRDVVDRAVLNHLAFEGLPHARRAARLLPGSARAHRLAGLAACRLAAALQDLGRDDPDLVLAGLPTWQTYRREAAASLSAARRALGSAPGPAAPPDPESALVVEALFEAGSRPADPAELARLVAEHGVDWAPGAPSSARLRVAEGLIDAGLVEPARRLLARMPQAAVPAEAAGTLLSGYRSWVFRRLSGARRAP